MTDLITRLKEATQIIKLLTPFSFLQQNDWRGANNYQAIERKNEAFEAYYKVRLVTSINHSDSVISNSLSFQQTSESIIDFPIHQVVVCLTFLSDYWHLSTACHFIFEMVRAPRHFLLGKVHPYEEIVNFYWSISRAPRH